MTVCAPYHSVEPQAEDVYHNNTICPVGQRITPQHRRDGIGVGRSLCGECVELDLQSWLDRPGPEEEKEMPD